MQFRAFFGCHVALLSALAYFLIVAVACGTSKAIVHHYDYHTGRRYDDPEPRYTANFILGVLLAGYLLCWLCVGVLCWRLASNETTDDGKKVSAERLGCQLKTIVRIELLLPFVLVFYIALVFITMSHPFVLVFYIALVFITMSHPGRSTPSMNGSS